MGLGGQPGNTKGPGRGDDPPLSLLMVGWLGFLVCLTGRVLGGDWGRELAGAGVGIATLAGMFFFARLADRAGRRKK